MIDNNRLMAAVLTVLTTSISSIATVWAADDDSVTPYRPSVSNPAELPRPGQLELEFGGLHEKKGRARNDSLPYLLKLGFSKEWGMLLGGEAYLWSHDEQGRRERGTGDTQLFLKRAYAINNATAFGLELGVNLPTAKSALGSGKADYILNGIYSHDIGRLRLDVNLAASRIGAPEPGTGRLETAFAAGLALPLNQSWTGIGELSAIVRRGVSTTGQVLAALAYSPDKKYSIDFGLAKGLTRASQDWSMFTGLVIPVATLW